MPRRRGQRFYRAQSEVDGFTMADGFTVPEPTMAATEILKLLQVLREHVTTGSFRSTNISLVDNILRASVHGYGVDWCSVVLASVSVTITVAKMRGQVWPVVSVDG